MAVEEKILAVKGPLTVPRKERESGKKHPKEFIWRKKSFSRGVRPNSWQGAKLLATANSWHICCH